MVADYIGISMSVMGLPLPGNQEALQRKKESDGVGNAFELLPGTVDAIICMVLEKFPVNNLNNMVVRKKSNNAFITPGGLNFLNL